MTATFTNARNALNEVVARTEANQKRLDQAKALIATADADLAAMPTAYQQIAADIETQLAASPDDPAWVALKAEKDLLVADFQAQRTRAAALKSAVVE